MLTKDLKQPMFSLIALALLTACGNNSSDSGGSTNENQPTIQTKTQKGKLVGADDEITYSCGNRVEQLEENGSFECNSMPITFSIEGVEIGTVVEIPNDNKIYMSDLLHIDRGDNSSKMQKIGHEDSVSDALNKLRPHLNAITDVISDDQAVKQAIEALVLDDQEPLTQSLELMSEGEYNTTIVWESSNENILSSDGQLTPPSSLDGEATVSLEAFVSRGEVSERVVYNFRVPVEGGVR
jgi:hypothetical protein